MSTTERQHARISKIAYDFAHDMGIEKLEFEPDGEIWTGKSSLGKVYKFHVKETGIEVWWD